MFSYTYNNHFTFGYDNSNRFQDRPNSEAQFTARYGSTSIKEITWVDSNRLAARKIYENRQGELYVLYSGGMDSELCLESFYSQGIPARSVSLRFKDIDQSYEQDFIWRFLKSRQIQHDFLDINLLDFLESKECAEILENSKCLSPIIAMQIWLANQIDGTPIVAQGEVHLKKRIRDEYVAGSSAYDNSPWDLIESERLCSLYRNFIKQNRPAVPGFFQYLPEQIHSYVFNNPLVQDLVENRVVGKLGTRTSKNRIIRHFYPHLPEREKRHGFEAIQALHDKLRAEQAAKFPFHDASVKISLQELQSQLTLD